MNVHHIWCNPKDHNLIAGWRITRRQFGLGPAQPPEFHITWIRKTRPSWTGPFLTSSHVASRAQPVESFHHAVNSAVNSLVADVFFALYRDFPVAERKRGEAAEYRQRQRHHCNVR